MSDALDTLVDRRRVAVGAGATELRRRLRRLGLTDKAALVAFVVLLLVSFIGPLLATHDPEAPVGPLFAPPGGGFPFGTDELGHDIFTRILYGARQPRARVRESSTGPLVLRWIRTASSMWPTG